ncbi:ATP-binding protein [uncultured Xanthomonas sp.]|uniref:ATP-binding protein n=1 Tax=uncultured Xanthomonas sp. TaxID=152831 RepID=UPI0025F54308|nr:ATP-binding protein [uncultured Xanthomonas sp.]
MSRAPGLRRQVILSLGALALWIILLSVVGSYVFYALAAAYQPNSISDTWVPSRVEMMWIGATAALAVAIAVAVAVRLSRRILTPLNSVAHSLREVAQGNLHARASMDAHALGETAQLVRDFNAMADRLQAMTRERAFWNAAVAHELRTPVTILRGRLQGLAEGVFVPDVAAFESLLRQVEGLSRLIEDLRVLSLTDSGHLELQSAPADLAREVEAVLHAFGASLDARGLVLEPVLALRTPVLCDAVRIRQALMALLENAQHYAEPGPLRVGVQADAGQCVLFVEDTGPGIAPEIAARVFDAFRRGDPSRSRKSGGSGLGLAVVKAIAVAHGGDALCLPAGSGTRFEVRWPLAPVEAATRTAQVPASR